MPKQHGEDGGNVEALEYRVENFIVMELRGRVDEINTGVLSDEIHTIINTGRCRLAIDLQNTDFLSAHCLSAIWKCQKRARSFGGDIVLFGARGKVHETIQFVRLSEVITCLSTKYDVIAYFANHVVPETQPSSSDTKPRRLAHALARFFQFIILLGLLAGTTLRYVALASNQGALTDAPAERRSSTAALSLEELQLLATSRSGQAQFQSLKQQERLQDLEMTRSLQLPTIAFTTGYLHQSNPNLITELANRELNQLRQRGAESEFSEFQSNSNFKIDQDLIVLSVGLVQSIYTGGLYQARQELAQNQIAEQESQGKLEAIGTKENVEKLYWGILLTEKKVELLRTKHSGAEARRTATEAKFRENAIARSELAEAKLSELSAMQELLGAQEDLAKMRISLNLLIGREADDEIRLKETKLKAIDELADIDDYLKLAANRHPELSFAASRIDTARSFQKTVSAGAVRSPKAFLFGGVDHTRGIADRTDLVNWTLGVAMSVPLYDGGRSFAETEKSRLLLEQARLGLEQSRRKIELDVREAIGEIRRARINLEIAEQGEELALDRARLARSAIHDGQAPQFEIDRVRSAEIEAQIAVLAAKAELLRWSTKLRSLTMEDQL